MTTITKEIARHIREIHFGNNWTWVSLQESLKDFDWRKADSSIESINSVNVLVYHMNFYLNVVHERLTKGIVKFSHDDSFQAPAIKSEKDWMELLDKTWRDAEAFAATVEKFPEEKLFEDLSPKHGSFYKNMHGVVEHNHYHLGQIVLLKKLLK